MKSLLRESPSQVNRSAVLDLDYPPDATPEAVALALVNAIKRMEKKRFVSQADPAADRK